MEKVKALSAYTLHNDKGEKLMMYYGRVLEANGTICSGKTKDQRYCFVGRNIPMPVRSNTWFEGFSEDTMLLWLHEHGWYAQARVRLSDGVIHLYHSTNIEKDKFDTAKFNEIINELWNNSRRVTACHLYRYAHGGTLDEASRAIRVIVDNQQQ